MQTILVDKVSTLIKSKTGINVSVGAVDFRPFNRVLLKNVYIEDLNKDTLIFAKRISVSLSTFKLNEGEYKLNKVAIDQAYINFVTDSSGMMNLTALLNKISSDTLKSQDSSNFILKSNQVIISNSHFNLKNVKAKHQEFGINFEDFSFNNLNIDAGDFYINADTIAIKINDLSLVDQSGFKLDKFRADFTLCSHYLNFDKLRIVAHGSSIKMNHFKMGFANWSNFSDFVNKIKLDADITNSYIKTTTIAYIIPSFRNIQLSATLNGQIKGPISDIRGKNLEITMGAQTKILTNVNVTGLPKIDQTLMVVDIKELSTTRNDLLSIKDQKNKSIIDIPADVDVLGKTTYKGNFTGYINNFVAYGTITSAIGKLAIDLSFLPDKNQGIAFEGNLNAINLDVGKLAQSDFIGRTTFHAKVKGSSDKEANVKAFTDATIKSFILNKYNYSDIEVSGNLSNKTYIGSVHLNDPNCKLNFLGKIDFSDSIPEFDFSAFVPKVDLVKLNLNTTDSISQASFLLTTKFTGSNLDNSKGEIKVLNSYYKNQRGEFKLSDIVISADNSVDSKMISLKSEFAEGEIRSKYNYSKVFAYLSDLFFKYAPAFNKKGDIKPLPTTGVEKPEYNDYLIKFRLKKTQKITTVISPEIKIAENSTIFGILNPDLQSLTFKIKIPEIQIGSTSVKELSVDGQTKDSTLVASIITPVIKFGETQVKNFKINTQVKNNILDFSLGWQNQEKPATYGLIEAIADFNESGKNGHIAQFHFKPSTFVLSDSTWQLSASTIAVDTSSIFIDNFSVSSLNQELTVKGNISTKEQDTLSINIKNLNISYLNLFLQNLGYSLQGKINGFARLNAIYSNPTLYADISINKLSANAKPVGDINFTSVWHNSEQRMAINLSNKQNDSITFSAKGNYYIENSNLNFDIDINKIKLDHLSPLLEGNISNLSGIIKGNLKITGTTKKPIINGNIVLDNSSLTVDFLKTQYTINDNISVENSDIFLKGFKINDRNRKTALVNGAIRTNYFKDFNLNLSLSTEGFQCMNTTEHDNSSFYGTVYGSGIVLVNGKPDDLNLNIKLKTENKTAIFLPLSSGSTVDQNNFITFINNDPNFIPIEETVVEEEKSNANLNLVLELQVTPEAEAQIIIDKKLGDIIKANGRGNLKLEINPSREIFKMFGNYIIEKGDYLFTLQGVINKKFRIEEGSNITWNGDPLDAIVDIEAVYRVRTSLEPLLRNNNTSRVPVDCQIFLTQKLMTPNIKFNIDVPNADNETKGLVGSILNTEEKINRQFIGLIGIGSFIMDSEQDTERGNSNLSTAGWNTVSELASNQLSNWVSQWSNNFDFGFNYRPGMEDQMTSDQWELALSTQILDDRVSINGNVDLGAKNTNNPIAGDFNLDVKLNKSGKLRFKAFARSNDEILLTNQENNYTTGAGILYREEFNNLSDLWTRIKNTFKPEEVNVPMIIIDNGINTEKKDSTLQQDSTNKTDNFIQIK
ncbi:MAG TPA: translocation/assembly module TamB domain-containing protein [Tenuifilaceae bacterium]|nr:translocation/assembly module TamB domain-containing protein [Tenuifilaceae bacterium]